jgi:hypothetical protein
MALTSWLAGRDLARLALNADLLPPSLLLNSKEARMNI